MNVEEVEAILGEVDKKELSREVFRWLKDNIEEYIDNHKKEYYVSFMADEEKHPQLFKIQDIYKNMNSIKIELSEGEDFEKDVNKIIEENDQVDEENIIAKKVSEFLEEVKGIMSSDEENIKDFYDKISFYYTIAGFYKGRPIKKEADGTIKIDYLNFENMDMEIYKRSFSINDENEKVYDEKEVIDTLLPAFAVDFRLMIWDKPLETLF